MLRKYFCFVLCLSIIAAFTLLSWSVPVNAATITLPNGNSSTIQNAINSASAGDTIIIPSGTFDLSSTVNITKRLTIQGAGYTKTTLRDSGINTYFKISANNIKISGIKFQGVSGSDVAIKIGNYQDFVIRDCEFNGVRSRGVETWGADTRGVISNCRFINPSNEGSGVCVMGDSSSGSGATNWNRYTRYNVDYGSQNWVFVEDSYFSGWRHAITSNLGSKYVFRYNEVVDSVDSYIDVHGPESGWDRGSRAYEIYNNYCHGSSTVYLGIHIRGGDGLIYNNRIEDITKSYYVCIQHTIYSGSNYTYPAADQIRDLYAWGNKKEGQVSVGVSIRDGYSHLFQEGRDYRNSQYSYTPYPYPHPLLGGSAPTPTPTATPTSTPTSTPTPTATPTPTPTPGNLITNLSVKDTANASKYSVKSNLQTGNKQYQDRTYTFSTLHSSVTGSDWIQTPAASKYYTGNPLLTFKVTANVYVYVAHADSISTKPSWLSGWTDTGYNIVNSEPKTFSLYRKAFSANSTVSLGPNTSNGANTSMYSIIVKRQ